MKDEFIIKFAFFEKRVSLEAVKISFYGRIVGQEREVPKNNEVIQGRDWDVMKNANLKMVTMGRRLMKGKTRMSGIEISLPKRKGPKRSQSSQIQLIASEKG